MHRSNPFNFPKNKNTTALLNQHVFSNNKGLALFIITVVLGAFAFWEFLISNMKQWSTFNDYFKMKLSFIGVFYEKLKPFISWSVLR
jgi:hypothetical protein